MRRLSVIVGTWLCASKRTALLGLCVLASLWGAISFQLRFENVTARQSATQNASNLARAFEESVIRWIRETDSTLIFLRNSYERGSEPDEWYKSALQIIHLSDLTLQFSIIGSNGLLKDSTIGPRPPPQTDLNDREHFKVTAGFQRDELFISKPLIGRVSNKWSIQLARQLHRRDGVFAGVMVASLDPTHLANFYKSIDIGEGAITLIGLDGVVRAQAGRYAPALGSSAGETPLFQLYQNAPTG